MSQSVAEHEPVGAVEEAEAVAAELFGTPEGRQDPFGGGRRRRPHGGAGVPAARPGDRRLLGVPLADCDQFRPLMQDLAGMFEMDPGPGVLDAADRAWVDIEVYFAELIVEKRKDPDDALISQLLAVDDNGDRLSDDEIIGLASLTFLAGLETTTSLIGNGMIGLLADPVQIDHLRADPGLFPRLPDELLRYDGTVQLVGRTTTDDLEVGGHVLPAGSSIMALIGAANRDPARFHERRTRQRRHRLARAAARRSGGG